MNDIFYPLIDGVVNVVDNYARELSKLPGIDVTLVVPGPRKQEDFDKYYRDLPYKVLMCKLSSVGFDGYNKSNISRAFKKRFAAEKFDLIHCHSIFGLYKMSLKVAKKQNIPVILTVHSQYRPDYKRYLKLPPLVWWWMKLTKWKLNKCDLLFSLNAGMDEYIRRDVGFRGKSVIVRNATHFTPPADIESVRAAARAKYGIAEGENVFCFLGRCVIKKGVLMILHALAVLRARGIPFRMFYVGASGFDEKKLRAEIKNLNLEKEVTVMGRVTHDEIVEVFSISKLFLFPSKFDVDCLVKREAASCLVPSVMLEKTYTNAEIIDGENGYISADGVPAFAEKIIAAISDEPKRQQVAACARETLAWSWREAIAEVHKIYLEVLEGSPSERSGGSPTG